MKFFIADSHGRELMSLDARGKTKRLVGNDSLESVQPVGAIARKSYLSQAIHTIIQVYVLYDHLISSL